MAEQRRVALPGSERPPVAHVEAAGAVHPDERFEITVYLRGRVQSKLEAHVDELAVRASEADQALSREAFAERYGADPRHVARVEAFARTNALVVVDVSVARRSVMLSGSAAQFSAAFGVKLEAFGHPGGGSFRGRQGPIYIPAHLADIVQGVFGLDDRPVARPHIRRLTPSAVRVSFSPVEIGRLYGFPTGVDGRGQSVAIIELGGGYQLDDLSTYFAQLGIDPRPTVVSVSVDHGLNRPTGLRGADGEVMLDVEVAGAVAPGATFVVYFAPNTDQGFIDAISTAVHDTAYRPSILSISWGAPEVLWTQASIQAMDQAFLAAAAMGVTVFCAAGDNGANDFPAGSGHQPGNHVDYPASNPNVIGCGGTYISVADNAITDEVVWNDARGGATGGGFSRLFSRPRWQTPYEDQTGRGVPDVCGNASPRSGYRVRVDGQDTVIGGTSAVAPLWSGLTALLNQQLGRPIGFANPVLYALAPSTGAFHDITSGDNGEYSAAPGWDPCTGLGRPDGGRLLQALSQTRPSGG
jgi:kumamolisin